MKPLLYSILWGLAVLLAIFTLILGYQCVFGDFQIYKATLKGPEQVYDGDTLKDVRILVFDFQDNITYRELWPGVYLTARGIEIETDIRIAGIDTPEKRPLKKGRTEASRLREKAAAARAQVALAKLLKENGNYTFRIQDPLLGKYAGRTVADVFVGDINVAAWLIRNGHAIGYDGGTKVPFDEWYKGD